MKKVVILLGVLVILFGVSSYLVFARHAKPSVVVTNNHGQYITVISFAPLQPVGPTTAVIVKSGSSVKYIMQHGSTVLVKKVLSISETGNQNKKASLVLHNGSLSAKYSQGLNIHIEKQSCSNDSDKACNYLVTVK